MALQLCKIEKIPGHRGNPKAGTGKWLKNQRNRKIRRSLWENYKNCFRKYKRTYF